MGLSEQLTEDMKTSMRAQDASRTGTLRLLRGAIKNEEIKLGHSLSDDEVQKVLVREAKQRRDSITAYEAAGRQDLVATEASELEIISGYLPKLLTEAELSKMVDDVIAETGASDQKAMGQVIGAVKARAGAAADGAMLAGMVKAKLGGAA